MRTSEAEPESENNQSLATNGESEDGNPGEEIDDDTLEFVNDDGTEAEPEDSISFNKLKHC